MRSAGNGEEGGEEVERSSAHFRGGRGGEGAEGLAAAWGLRQGGEGRSGDAEAFDHAVGEFVAELEGVFTQELATDGIAARRGGGIDARREGVLLREGVPLVPRWGEREGIAVVGVEFAEEGEALGVVGCERGGEAEAEWFGEGHLQISKIPNCQMAKSEGEEERGEAGRGPLDKRGAECTRVRLYPWR